MEPAGVIQAVPKNVATKGASSVICLTEFGAQIFHFSQTDYGIQMLCNYYNLWTMEYGIQI